MNRISTVVAAGVAALSFSTAAQSADLIISQPAMPGIVSVSSNWEGAYVGVFGGFASGEIYDSPANETLDASGWLVGVNAGIDFYLTDGVVAGIVGDIAWAGIAYDDFDADDIGIDWQGSLRGRLGFDAGRFMPYLTAGLAVAHGNIDAASATHIGWTAGAGVELAITEDLSVDLLYRYSDYGLQDYPGTAVDFGFRTHQVSLGLNWRF